MQICLDVPAQFLLSCRDLARYRTKREHQQLKKVLVETAHEVVLRWATLFLLCGQLMLFKAAASCGNLFQDCLGLLDHDLSQALRALREALIRLARRRISCVLSINEREEALGNETLGLSADLGVS